MNPSLESSRNVAGAASLVERSYLASEFDIVCTVCKVLRVYPRIKHVFRVTHLSDASRTLARSAILNADGAS